MINGKKIQKVKDSVLIPDEVVPIYESELMALVNKHDVKNIEKAKKELDRKFTDLNNLGLLVFL